LRRFPGAANYIWFENPPPRSEEAARFRDRQPPVLIDSRFSTVICAPVYSHHDGLSIQIKVGADEGLKHESSIHSDELVSLPKTLLTRYLGKMDARKIEELNAALGVALALDEAS
jgi:mRNA interferase MazF